MVIKKIENIFSYNIKYKFNFAFLLLLVFYWNHGFYGSVLTQNISLNTFFLSTLLMNIVVLFLSYFALGNNENFICEIQIYGKDFFNFVLYSIILLYISFDNFISYPKYDSVITAESAHGHGIEFLRIASTLFDIPDHIKYKYLLLSFDFIVLLFISFFIFLVIKLSKRNIFIAVGFLSIFFVLTRTLIYLSGGFGSGQPPFRLFPVWLASSFFLLTNFSFKLPGFFSLIFCMCFFQKQYNSTDAHD